MILIKLKTLKIIAGVVLGAEITGLLMCTVGSIITGIGGDEEQTV